MFWKLFGKSKKNRYNYKEPEIGSKIIEEYGSDIMVACVTGMSGFRQIEKLNEFCTHMAEAALQGDFFGIAISCFCQHSEPLNKYLPISINCMPDEAFLIFNELLRNHATTGFSKSLKKYLSSNKDEVEKKASEKNPYALWLMGSWYAFDNFEKKGHDECMKERIYWYERSAFEGYLPAIQGIAGLYDNGNTSTPNDLKKAAYWYREGALQGDSISAYNLGVMYSLGSFVEKNNGVASEWLSLAYNNSNDIAFDKHIEEFAKKFGIHLKLSPNLIEDPELYDLTYEFKDAYEHDYKSNYGSKLYKWINKNSSRNKYEPPEIETWDDIKSLRLSSQDITDLSSDILILISLVELNLSYNRLSIIPDIVFNLTNLQRLDLSINSMVYLPPEIGQLKELKHLDLSENKLSSLPVEIGELTSLEYLALYNNNLINLPKEIGSMTSLKHISIWDNNLSSLPEEIINLNNLEIIEVEGNNFTDDYVEFLRKKFSNTNCTISFGRQQCNFSDKINVVNNIKGGSIEPSFLKMHLNSKYGDTVTNIFYYPIDSDEDDGDGDLLSLDPNEFTRKLLANRRYNKISANKGLNAIDSENKFVPIDIELNAEIPSTQYELLQWVKITYIKICSEHDLKPNSNLRVVSLGSSAKATLTMTERTEEPPLHETIWDPI